MANNKKDQVLRISRMESARKERITMAYNTIKKSPNIEDNKLAAIICSETGCSWRTAREYIKIARIKHDTI